MCNFQEQAQRGAGPVAGGDGESAAPVSGSNPGSKVRFMVHRRMIFVCGRIWLKISDKVLLVVLCDTYEVHHADITISCFLVVVWVLV